MKGGKQLGQTVHENRVSIERRLNMLGQDLTNQGFGKVRVKGRITVEVFDDDGAKGVHAIEVNFSQYQKGKGPRSINGDGNVDLNVPVTVSTSTVTNPSVTSKSVWSTDSDDD